MNPSRTRFFGTALVVLVVAMVCAISCWPTSSRAQAPNAKANDSKVKALLSDKLTVAQELAKHTRASFEAGRATFMEVLDANQIVHKVELDLCNSDAERIPILEAMLTEAQDLEKIASQQVQGGILSPTAVFSAKLSRLDAQIALERAKSK